MRGFVKIPYHRLFYFLLILFLPTQLGYHFWPSWTVILGRRVDYLSPTLYFTDLLVLITLLSWIVSQKFSVQHIRKILRKQNRKSLVIIVLSASLVAANILFSRSPANTIIGWLKAIEYCCLGYYIIKTQPNDRTTHVFLLYAGVFMSILGITQFLHQGSLGGILWWIGERSFTTDTPGIAKAVLCISSSCTSMLRPYATLPHPNVLAGFLGTVLLLGVLRNRRQETGRPFYISKIAYLPLLGLCALAFLLTDSRSAFFSLAITGSFFFIKNKRIRVVLVLSTILFLMLLTLPIAPAWFSDYESVSVRQYLVGSALHMITSHPLFGVGLHGFLVALPDALVVRSIYFLQPVHNIYILLLSELGTSGVGLLIFIGAMVSKSLNKRQPSPWCYPLLFLLLIGFLDHYLLSLQQGQLLLTIVLSYSLSQIKRTTADRTDIDKKDQ